ncbi:MAG: hypothetical protein FJ296_04020 [Planctomycetes bacterium]|nr:hypothetical protein [Planctomycetota bacterium]
MRQRLIHGHGLRDSVIVDRTRLVPAVERHGDEFFPRVRAVARENRRFADTVMLCAAFGPLRQRRRLARRKADIRRWHGGSRP